ncbi:hypothetical protein V8E55_012214 [Tylopilus felleus]
MTWSINLRNALCPSSEILLVDKRLLRAISIQNLFRNKVKCVKSENQLLGKKWLIKSLLPGFTDSTLSTPPTSPQRAQSTARQAECDQRQLGSPPSRRHPHSVMQPSDVPPALRIHPPVPVHQYPGLPRHQIQLPPPLPPPMPPAFDQLPNQPLPYQAFVPPPSEPQHFPQMSARVDYNARLLQGFNQTHERRRNRRRGHFSVSHSEPGPVLPPPQNLQIHQHVINFQHGNCNSYSSNGKSIITKYNCGKSRCKDKNRSIKGWWSYNNRSYITKEFLRSNKSKCDNKSYIIKDIFRSSNRHYKHYSNKKRSMNVKSALQFSKLDSFLKLCFQRL